MTTPSQTGWPFYEDAWLGVSLDLRGMGVTTDALEAAAPRVAQALEAMTALEAGGLANPSEGRRVGHYWLRCPELAPEPQMALDIEATQERVWQAAQELARFETVLHVGIGGSSLGPQLLVDALGDPKRTLHFLDNIDPDGIADVLNQVSLPTLAVVVVSKSGTTPETMGALAEVEAALTAEGLTLADRTVAITQEGSALAQRALTEGWLAVLPMWDWVGGRTSVTSAVGLLPGAVAGVNIDWLIEGAARMDEWTRAQSLEANPALGLAVAWLSATGGQAARANVVLPYADRLSVFAPFLQQLCMESLGKGQALDGSAVAQGLTVYGNKGATDQHSYVQQLREGPDDHFITFVELLDITSGAAGDTLSAMLAGTRAALTESGRRTMTLSVERFGAHQLGALIALFERAVGFYASFVGINAYDQPGVEAGKRCARDVLSLQGQLLERLAAGESGDAASFATALEADVDLVFHVLRHLAATGRATAEGLGLSRNFSR